MEHSFHGIGYGEIVLQLVFLILAILFFVFICLFLLNSIIRGYKKSRDLGESNQIKEKNKEEIK
ncbi:hypothetical protein [Gottfriedia luciferensis]|uniref:hypothetical protein n=1 Tax=Gottfriedia luciferensis TaxID=178774 RepID=UPI000B454F04|nr:hypothetical protein [Gottfriedia luciferensis]